MKMLFDENRRLIARIAPDSLAGSSLRLEIAKLKFLRELVKAVNESVFMVWIGCKLK